MTVSVCPIATVDAPLERVWTLLVQPSLYDQWWDAVTRAIEPAGAAHGGQKILAHTRSFGTTWEVRVVIERVDRAHHTLDLTTRLPFGITSHNLMVCVALDDSHCRVTFG